MNDTPPDPLPDPSPPETTPTARLRPPERRVSRRAIGVWTVRLLVGGLFLTALLTAAAWALTSLGWTWPPVWVREYAPLVPVVYGTYALLRVAIVPSWRYRVHRWEVAADVIYTRSGWLSRTWQLVPVNRLQTVDHTQGWLERLFTVATLEVQTASYAGSSTIEGLDAEEARRLSEDLAVRAGTLRDDAT
ncbi:PH domain-containing protein [Nocardiopsis flavescens]|uniref:PH domain-containing protein n=1 Tax=Nocardiopsis flavescens TaxID=758803 RepID=UPI000934A8FA|nr:PH domain-containing protein [Nocardiopsis flavescens]